jgi:hypothetical protein
MPASRNPQSDGHALALCGGRIWGTGAAEGGYDDDCEAAGDSDGFGRGIVTSFAIASSQAASDNATTISNCSIMFMSEKPANALPTRRRMQASHSPRTASVKLSRLEWRRWLIQLPRSNQHGSPLCLGGDWYGLDSVSRRGHASLPVGTTTNEPSRGFVRPRQSEAQSNIHRPPPHPFASLQRFP